MSTKACGLGLWGRNGAGKTTTMRMLAGEHDHGQAEFEGQVSRRGTIGYLPQDTRIGDPEQIAKDRILSVRGIDEIIARIRKAEHIMGTATGPKQQKAMERYVRLDQEFTNQGGWAANAKASQIAASLGLDDRILKQPLKTLSGGQRRRVELARALFSDAEVLLLDEPTNHLDHDSLIWLRDFLRTYPGGFIVISHDVDLIRDTVNHVYHLDAERGVVDIYNMGWDLYLKQREEDERRRRRERAAALKKAESLRLQGEKMRAKATKAVAAQQMLRRAEELEKSVEPVRTQEKVARLRFPEPAPSGKVPLVGEHLSKTFGSLEVFTGVDLAIDRGSKVIVLGLNGAGKTTLLRILAGVLEPDTGEVKPGYGLKLGYYAQEHETLDPTKTVLQTMVDAAPAFDDTRPVRNVLGQFLFSGKTWTSPFRSFRVANRPAWRWRPWLCQRRTFCFLTSRPTTLIPLRAKKSFTPFNVRGRSCAGHPRSGRGQSGTGPRLLLPTVTKTCGTTSIWTGRANLAVLRDCPRLISGPGLSSLIGRAGPLSGFDGAEPLLSLIGRVGATRQSLDSAKEALLCGLFLGV